MCLETLVNYYTGLVNCTKIDSMVNFLASFNIDKLLNIQEGIDLFKVSVGNVIDDKALNIGIGFNQVIYAV